MNITIEPGASALLDALHRAGFAAYVVGGCVRDSLLGLAPHDWDLCTAARPEQVMELFGEKQCIPTGLQHGTVTVKRDGRLYEITTFRTEGSYSDGRHPDSVAFVPDVREDLARRDFTINAMAYSAEEGLCDSFGGQEDLARGVVRAVGEPLRRFEEDALRILRLYRFAARFGFVIDEATEAAAKQLAAHLDCVSVERIEEHRCPSGRSRGSDHPLGGAASAAGGGWNTKGVETLEMLQCCDRWSINTCEGESSPYSYAVASSQTTSWQIRPPHRAAVDCPLERSSTGKKR